MVRADGDYYVATLDANGNTSSKQLQIGWTDQLEVLHDGYLTASHSHLVRYNSKGDSLWVKTMPRVNSLGDFKQVENNNLLFAYSSQDGSAADKLVLVKTDSSGNYIWSHNYEFRATDILVDHQNNYVITGRNDSIIVVLKVSPAGDSLSTELYPQTHTIRRAYSILSSRNELVTLASFNIWGGQSKIVVIMNTHPVGIQKIKSKPKVKAYPNPTQNVLNVQCSAQWGTPKNIELYDLSGRLRASFLSFAKEGSSLYRLDTKSLPAGSYTLKVFYDGSTSVARVVLVR